jgi:hypothetical protein
MVESLKNILPVTLFIVGRGIEMIGRFFVGVATIIYNVTATMHVQLNTNTGKKLKEIEKQVADVMKMYAAVASKVTAASNEENRLANTIKNDPNVVQLGKKKNDDTKS